MSERWFVRCIDCNGDYGDHFACEGGINHGQREMRLLYLAREALAVLGETELATVRGVDVTIGSSLCSNIEGHSVNVEWWAEHRGHKLAVVSEYGEFDELVFPSQLSPDDEVRFQADSWPGLGRIDLKAKVVRVVGTYAVIDVDGASYGPCDADVRGCGLHISYLEPRPMLKGSWEKGDGA